VVAAVAVALNVVISLWLRLGRDDLNVRAAYVHLTLAQSTADRMVQAQFPHHCSSTSCGEWMQDTATV
jgi:hypothetical protein